MVTDERRREWIVCPLRAQERRGQGVPERKARKVTPTGRTGTQEAGRERTLTAKVFPHRQTNTGGGPGGRPFYIMQARQVGKRPKTTRSEEREHSDRAGRPEKRPTTVIRQERDPKQAEEELSRDIFLRPRIARLRV